MFQDSMQKELFSHFHSVDILCIVKQCIFKTIQIMLINN